MRRELWAYVMTDDDGEEGVAFVETASGTKVPMIATSEAGARALSPIAERMVQILDRPWTLVHYSKADEEEVLSP